MTHITMQSEKLTLMANAALTRVRKNRQGKWRAAIIEARKPHWLTRRRRTLKQAVEHLKSDCDYFTTWLSIKCVSAKQEQICKSLLAMAKENFIVVVDRDDYEWL